MKLYGLLGHPLGHSFSQKYFTEKFGKEGIKDCRYELFDIDNIEKIKNIIAQNPDIQGFNVTTPYKETVIPFLDELDKSAEEVGAVNVIKVKGKKLIGYNSDVYGFEQSLSNWLNELKKSLPSQGFVLGTGGAAKSIHHVLQKNKCETYFVSRNSKLRCFDYGDFDFFLKVNKSPIIIVNATPVGTFPNIDEKPGFDYKRLKTSALVYDLVYNPAETAFMKAAAAQKCEVKNGQEMLELQAEKAWEIWNK
jgi:shikimate dehydrogenase